MEKSQVVDWYKDQHIFVTGATGFMGKILIEKLLRSCTGIGGIYILIRQKRDQEPSKRLLEYLKNPIFDNIRSLPDSTSRFQKLHCVRGDVIKSNCALSDVDITALSEKITIVFHMAACVRFDQPLKDIVMMNVGGTRNVLDVAMQFQQLKVFLHVSTSYCHLDIPELEEKMYPAKHDPWKLLDAVQWMDEEMLNSLAPVLLKGYPNTYSYAKCLTEQLVSDYSDKLPIVIARPSIVAAVYKEPIPGWVDNINGPTGILIGAGKGVIRTMHCNTKLVADVVPVDMVINSILLAAWEQGVKELKAGIEVYNITANMDQPLSWGEALEMGRRYVYQYPYSTCLWYPGGSPKSNYLVHVVAAFFFHLIPAYFVDLMMTLTGNKPFMVRTQRRIQQGLNLLQYYTTRTWIFHNEKMKRLYDNLSERDKEIFYTNREPLQFDEYMLNYILGARKYCVKEGDETVPYARKVLKRLYYLDMLKNILLCALLLWIAHALIITVILVTKYYLETGFNLSVDLLHKTLPSLEFTVQVAVLLNVILINLYWMEDVEELRQLMKISVYLRQFGRKEYHNRYKNVYISLTAWISLGLVIDLGYSLFGDLKWVDYLSVVIRILVGMLIYPYFEFQVMLKICHATSIRQILHQVEKEIDLKLNKPVQTIQEQDETDFLRKLRKLRMLYMSIMDNISSKNKRERNLMITFVVMSYLLQIFLMFLLILTISGELELHKWHIPSLLKMGIGTGSFIYLLSLMNQSDDSIKNMLAWMYQLPISSRFNALEMREITADVVVNAMVVTQLYHWFTKK